MNDVKKPIRLILLSGFFGAGKTTLLKRLLAGRRQEGAPRAGVLVNEFGRLDMDGRVLPNESIELVEITNGSIFCACLKASFVSALIAFSAQEIDVLYVENSGLADPSEMDALLGSIAPRLARPYAYDGAVCLVDCAAFLDVVDVMAAAENQVASAGRVVLNKVDLVSPDTLRAVRAAVRRINPGARMFETSFAALDPAALFSAAAPAKAQRACVNRPANRPGSLLVRADGIFSEEALLAFLQAAGEHAYRIKGFAETPGGWRRAEFSGGRAELPAAEKPDGIDRLTLVIVTRTPDANRAVRACWDAILSVPAEWEGSQAAPRRRIHVVTGGSKWNR